jgi:hypothetical protein
MREIIAERLASTLRRCSDGAAERRRKATKRLHEGGHDSSWWQAHMRAVLWHERDGDRSAQWPGSRRQTPVACAEGKIWGKKPLSDGPVQRQRSMTGGPL